MLEPSTPMPWSPEGAAPPLPEALWIERVINPQRGGATTSQNQPVVGMVRHASHPFCRVIEVSIAAPQFEQSCQAVAFDYLQALAEVLAVLSKPQRLLHPDILNALNPQQPSYNGVHCFGWLRIARGLTATNQHDAPHTSFWSSRSDDGKTVDRVLVLLAGYTLHGLSLGGDVGLRLALQVDEISVGKGAPQTRLRIHGVTLSRLDPDQKPAQVPDNLQPFARKPALAQRLLQALNAEISKALNFNGGALVRSMELVEQPEGLLRLRGQGARRRDVASGPSARARVYSFELEVAVEAPAQGKGPISCQVRKVVHVDELSSSVLPKNLRREELRLVERGLTVFERDPASCGPADTLRERRPARDSTRLDPFRVNLDHQAHFVGVDDKLLGFSDGRCFEVQGVKPRDDTATTVPTMARLLRKQTHSTQQQAAQAAQSGAGGARTPDERTAAMHRFERLPLRSDSLAAAQAHVRAQELFMRLQAYGLDAQAYFRHARLPLVLRPRAAMPGAADGDAVNAEVRPFWEGDLPAHPVPSGDEESTASIDERPQLLVKFASADPRQRQALPVLDQPQRRRAQYLGIAADPRWAWHEFGHVLNFASTGELEFPFAHSAGDALAAIATDPDSMLAWDEDARFLTFPWVEVARRHDRSAWAGYCWCGQRNLLRLATDRPIARHQHDYFEEQILSASLFRLYQCLGGDTRDLKRAVPPPIDAPEDDLDTAIRRAASDYCIYLIMRGISLLGPDSVAPARTPDQFVSALIDADLGTGDWQVQAHWPLRYKKPRDLQRQGGQAHKVIRWAFEQQGLYATDEPLQTREGPGRPPAVDLFIADRRLHAASHRKGQAALDGGYHPVPLRWHGSKAQAWHAHLQALWREGSALRLQLHNRGTHSASDIQAQLWVRAAGAKAQPPWQLLQTRSLPNAARTPEVLAFILPDEAPAGPLWVLANAHCSADPSNLPLDQPPPTDPEALVNLVSGDNNLALARL